MDSYPRKVTRRVLPNTQLQMPRTINFNNKIQELAYRQGYEKGINDILMATTEDKGPYFFDSFWYKAILAWIQEARMGNIKNQEPPHFTGRVIQDLGRYFKL